MKVFLSHSTRDAAFVTQLAKRMRADGFEPWLCEHSIDPASNWIEEIDEGLKAANLVLLVWSPDAAASYATTMEWTSALAREIAAKRLRLGVVMLRDCELPELLRTRQYIDARKNSDEAIAAVLDWLNGRRDLGRLAGDYAPVYLEGYPQDDLFVGRSSYLTQLRTVFSEGPVRFLLHGEPGAGKSTLALRFAWEVQKDFDAVVFQRCGQRSLDEIAGDLAYTLRGQLGEQVPQLPPEKKLEAAAEWLRARQSMLVLDDVWSTDIKQLEPGGACSVLHTSRQQSLPWISASHTREVVSFTDEECISLFHITLDSDFGRDEVSQHREALLDFAARVERLPIAVAVGASLLRQKKASGLHRGTLRLHLEELRDGVHDVPGLFRAAIESQPEREQKLLAACAVCVQEGFWLPLAAEIAELSEDDSDDAANRLAQASLLRVIDPRRRRVQLHALLRVEVRAQQIEENEPKKSLWRRLCASLRSVKLQRLQEHHAGAVERLFEDWEVSWQECGECLEEIIPVVKFLAGRGESDRQWQLSLNGYLLGLRIGELDSALRIMKHEASFLAGRNDFNARSGVAASYGNQAVILRHWGRLAEALELHKKQEAICRDLGDTNGLAGSYGNQANVLYMWGKLEEALELHKKGDAIHLKLGNDNDLQTSYGNQVATLRELGQLEQAIELLKKQEAICLRLDNKDGLQRSYGNKALIVWEWGRLDEALMLLKKQEGICLELGNRGDLVGTYENQALILIEKARLEEASILLRKSEVVCIELGLKRELGHCYWQWGLLARAQDDRKGEKEKLEQALTIFTELKMPRQCEEVQAELNNPEGQD